MIRSMTGFGKAERLAPNKKFSVEIRSLNSKQLDLSIKMPSAYRSLEPEIRTLATKALQRGKVEIFVTAESTAVEHNYMITLYALDIESLETSRLRPI